MQTIETSTPETPEAVLTESAVETAPSVEELLGAYIDKPEKLPYYLAGYEKMNQAGAFGFKWHFSWWGFFFGWAFLLYRKAYIPALVTFVLSVVLGMIPFVFLPVMIATGGVSSYFILKRFHEFRLQLQGTKTEQLAAMRSFGGVNNWVVWVIGGFYGLLLLGMISAMMTSGMH